MNINKFTEVMVTKTAQGRCEVEIERGSMDIWGDKVLKRNCTYKSITPSSANRLNIVLSTGEWASFSVEYPDLSDADGTPNFAVSTIYKYLMAGYQTDSKLKVFATKTPIKNSTIKILEKVIEP